MTEKSLYERLGGVFAIAAVVDHFSEAVVQNPIVGKTSKNAALGHWHTKNLARLPGLKFMRTLWVCAVAGGPFPYTPTRAGKTNLGLEEAHRDLRISPDEFDEVAAELGRTLDFVKVPRREQEEILAAFAAHKAEVTAGSNDPVEAIAQRRTTKEGGSMTDKPLETKQGDDSRIQVEQDHEVRYWSAKFGVSRDEIRQAVEAAGPMVKDVQRHLNR